MPITAPAAPLHVYLTWQGDTATTMTVNFHTDGKAGDSRVYYDAESGDGSPGSYRHQADGTAHRIPGVPDRWVHAVEITRLVPGQDIYFIAGNETSGYSAERKFKTVPGQATAFRFVTGGDMDVYPVMGELLEKAAAREPDFAVVGGDIAYADGRPERLGRWDAWLKYWELCMVTPRGYTVPLVLAIGNHEVQGHYQKTYREAPFYISLFAQNGNKSFFSRRFGKDLVLYVLDSGHTQPYGGIQSRWLRNALRQYRETEHKIAVYHVPIYPSHRPFDEGGSGKASGWGRKHWVPLFDEYGMDIAFENHDHTYKRTFPLKGNKVAPQGTVYFGDGAWGTPGLRTIDKAGRWYLKKAGTWQHFWVVEVKGEQLECRAVDVEGRVFDVYPETLPDAAAAEAYFKTLQPVYGGEPAALLPYLKRLMEPSPLAEKE